MPNNCPKNSSGRHLKTGRLNGYTAKELLAMLLMYLLWKSRVVNRQKNEIDADKVNGLLYVVGLHVGMCIHV